MKLVCSNGHEVKWRDKKCPECNEGLRLRDYLKRRIKRLFSGPLVYCTNQECRKAFPVGYSQCPFCEIQNNVPKAFESAKDAVLEQIENVSLVNRRKFQRFYLLLSAICLFAIFLRMSKLELEDWVRIGVVSVIYLGAIGVLIKWFVRREIILKFLLLTSWVVKLALILNYLSSLMLLQMIVINWWAQFMALAALVVISYCGAWVFCWLFWPMSGYLKITFLGDDGNNSFDSLLYQGRRGRFDRNQGGDDDIPF